jgi:hypothetical protein
VKKLQDQQMMVVLGLHVSLKLLGAFFFSFCSCPPPPPPPPSPLSLPSTSYYNNEADNLYEQRRDEEAIQLLVGNEKALHDALRMLGPHQEDDATRDALEAELEETNRLMDAIDQTVEEEHRRAAAHHHRTPSYPAPNAGYYDNSAYPNPQIPQVALIFFLILFFLSKVAISTSTS